MAQRGNTGWVKSHYNATVRSTKARGEDWTASVKTLRAGFNCPLTEFNAFSVIIKHKKMGSQMITFFSLQLFPKLQ